MVGRENHPGVGVQPGRGEHIEQLPDRGVSSGDRAVELREIAADVVGVGPAVGQLHLVDVGGCVPLAWVRPVRFEEARGQ